MCDADDRNVLSFESQGSISSQCMSDGKMELENQLEHVEAEEPSAGSNVKSSEVRQDAMDDSLDLFHELLDAAGLAYSNIPETAATTISLKTNGEVSTDMSDCPNRGDCDDSNSVIQVFPVISPTDSVLGRSPADSPVQRIAANLPFASLKPCGSRKRCAHRELLETVICSKSHSPCSSSSLVSEHGELRYWAETVSLEKNNDFVQNENCELGMSGKPSGDGPDGSRREGGEPDGGRTLRRLRRSLRLTETVVSCPVCKLQVRPDDLQAHIQHEMDKLTKISSTYKHRKTPSSSDVAARKQTFLSVKTNRQARVRARIRSECLLNTPCPVCQELINGTMTELNDHVEECLMRVEHATEDTDVNVESDFEEYEWAGQTRVRATSMLPHNSLSLLAQSSVTVVSLPQVRPNEVTDDLDIEEDDSFLYGQSQYTEACLIQCASDEPEDERQRRQVLRNALIEGESSSTLPGSPSRDSKWNDLTNGRNSSSTSANVLSPERPLNRLPSAHSSSSPSKTHLSSGSSARLIECLKRKLLEQEKRLVSNDTPRCLICMESYTRPVTSIQCWHVHCEECWLRTLGVKKLCPQCNTITSPTDLRKIYL